jgi:hypothetical protein
MMIRAGESAPFIRCIAAGTSSIPINSPTIVLKPIAPELATASTQDARVTLVDWSSNGAYRFTLSLKSIFVEMFSCCGADNILLIAKAAS